MSCEKKKQAIAYCGLACIECSHGAECVGCQNGGCDAHGWCKNFNCCREKGIDGCWQCEMSGEIGKEVTCKGGMLAKTRIAAFTQFVKKYGVDELARRLEINRKEGVIYHYEGRLDGDYDKGKTVDEVIDIITGGAEALKRYV